MQYCHFCFQNKNEFGESISNVCTSCEIEIMQLVEQGEAEKKAKPPQKKQTAEEIAESVEKMYAAMGYLCKSI